MTLHITAETTPPSALLERRLGTVLFNQIKPSLDKAQAAEATIDRLTPDPAHARAERTAALESVITSAIEEIAARLGSMHRSARTTTLQEHIKKRDDFKPKRAVIQRVLKKHGLY